MKREMLFILVVIGFVAIGIEGKKIGCVEEAVPDGTNSGLVGAPIAVKIDDTIREVALNCSEQWNEKPEQSGSQNFFKVVCIKSAKSQVVSGALYTLKVTLAETECKKSDLLSQSQDEKLSQSQVDACAVKMDGDVLSCEFTYWSQPWEDKYELTESTC